MKAVILGRVSTEDKTQDPEVQVSALQASAERLGWEVVAVVRKKQSAWDAKSCREVQQAVLDACAAQGAGVVMVEALDRISRGKPSQTVRFIEELEEHHGIRFWSRREPFLSTSSDASRGFLLPVFAWMAEQESHQRSERGKQKAIYKRQAAGKLGQRALWGRGAMASELDRRRIHDLRASGATVRAIAQTVGLSVGSVHRVLKQPSPVHSVPEERGGGNTEKPGPGDGGRLEQAVGLSDAAGASGPAVRETAGLREPSGKPSVEPAGIDLEENGMSANQAERKEG